VKRSFRLTGTNDFKRVRRTGRSYAHPLVVLIALRSEEDKPRFAVSASRSVGKAVQRNRAKRLIREAVRPVLPQVSPGWDIVLLARERIGGASQDQVREAVMELFERARLFTGTGSGESG
jgi:ribonuclease P protein component